MHSFQKSFPCVKSRATIHAQRQCEFIEHLVANIKEGSIPLWLFQHDPYIALRFSKKKIVSGNYFQHLQTLSIFNQISFQLIQLKYQSLRYVIQKCILLQGKPFQILHNLALIECINSNGPNKHVISGGKLNKLHVIPRPLNLFQCAGFNPSKEIELQISHSPSSISLGKEGQ